MKIVRYTILILAAITFSKHVRSNSPNHEISTKLPELIDQDFKTFEVAFFDQQALAKPENFRKDELHGSGIYNAKTQTATINFNNILTQNQAVTPAWVQNPAYVQIGTMPTENYVATAGKSLGSRSKITRLYGIIDDPFDHIVYPTDNQQNVFEINFNRIIEHQRHTKMQGRYFPEKKQATIVFTNVIESASPDNPTDSRYVQIGSYSGTPLKYRNLGPNAIIPMIAQTFTLFGIPETSLPEQQIQKKPLKNHALKRDLNSKMVTKDKQQYVAVIEYNPLSNNVPSINNPAMTHISDINNPNDFGPNLQLWGIPVQGKKIPVKNADQKTIGYYWQEQNIVQLLDGRTFVEIMQKAASNYKQHTFHGIGPVWTWYQTAEYDDALAQKYNMSSYQPNFNQLVDQDGIGTIRHDRQKYTLFGVLLSPRLTQSAIVTTRSATRPLLSNQVIRELKQAAAENPSTKITPVVNRSTLAAGFVYNLTRH